MQVVDKRLEMKEAELADTLKTLEACIHLSYAGDDTPEFSVDSDLAINQFLKLTNTSPEAPSVITSAQSHVAKCVLTVARLQTGIHPARCNVSHLPWLKRGEYNSVSVAAVDAFGEPIRGLTAGDVVCAVVCDGGWSVMSVDVESSTITVGLLLLVECSDVAVLDVVIGGIEVTIPLKVCADFITTPLVLVVPLVCTLYARRPLLRKCNQLLWRSVSTSIHWRKPNVKRR